jgi:hypothetical protein
VHPVLKSIMDANFWTTTGFQFNTPATTRATGVVDAGKLGLAMPGVDLGQSVSMPYGTVDINSAASIELLLGQHQQRLAASGMCALNIRRICCTVLSAV